MIKQLLYTTYSILFPSIQAKRVIPWFKDNGDKSLRLDYPMLDKNSIVFDLGGYEGQWASDIFSKYQSYIYIFEPYKIYAENIKTRFSKNNNITVFPFGLGKQNSKETLNISADGSSVFKSSANQDITEIEIVEAKKFIDDQNIPFIDLMKINIEGGEYDLLENLIVTGKTMSIKNIQVQFHDFVPEARSRMKAIQDSLSKTHKITYQYEFVWENWELK